MVKPLSLPTIQALADDTPYGGTRVLDSLSAATILSAANWLSDFDNWEGAGSELTTDEMDEIDALVGELVNDVLVGGVPEVGNFVKIDEVVYTADVAYPTITGMDTSDYERLKIVISGMLTNSSAGYADWVKVQFNEDTSTAKYWDFGRFFYNGGQSNTESIATVAGLLTAAMATSQPPNAGVFGNTEMMIYNNLSSEKKHVQSRTMIGGTIAGELAYVESLGVFNDGLPIDAITLVANVGTTFLIDTTSGNEPNELRITVYGMD